ncbi:Transposase and inactivated derivatives, IS30 family [Exiguobacterium aurantiacum]|uniref:Transposase and inactivated derivatives, IS30 family n=1 Tax=Exiguobacterium aurantiacum TaxID=33987 RepID=A0A377FR43_9BACL|nr:Transposase and inactivated derivatives, IS30 family [Exiguobacterium aurantiacum]
MSYTHLTTAERVKIETYLELGMSVRSIARRLGRQPSTVSREIRRNPGYTAERAQERYANAKRNCGAKTKLDDMMRRTIIEKLRATWSPEQIVGRLFDGKIAFSTIYRWIYSGLIDVPVTVLRQKGKRQKPIETRGRFNIGLSIAKRPREVRTRETFGHWELDPVVSGREVEGVRRDVHRAKEPVLPRPADRGPQRGLDGGGDPHGPRGLPSGHVQDGDDGPGQGVQLSRARPGDTRRADVFRRPVLVVAARQQRERQRPPARVLPERIGLRDGRPGRDRGRARQDQRAAEEMSRLEDRTRGLRGGSVALNLTNRHVLKWQYIFLKYK